jgi:hypothetical protein
MGRARRFGEEPREFFFGKTQCIVGGRCPSTMTKDKLFRVVAASRFGSAEVAAMHGRPTQQQRAPQHNQLLDSHGPAERIRGSPRRRRCCQVDLFRPVGGSKTNSPPVVVR